MKNGENRNIVRRNNKIWYFKIKKKIVYMLIRRNSLNKHDEI